MSERIIKNPEALRALAERMVSMSSVAPSLSDAAQRTVEVLTVIAETEHEHTKKIEQERDDALARVKELEEEVERVQRFGRGLQEVMDKTYGELRQELGKTNKQNAVLEKQIDFLASDVQCAKLASELASKEREALRDFTRDMLSFMRAHGNTNGGQIQRWTDRLMERAAALLGTEEPK